MPTQKEMSKIYVARWRAKDPERAAALDRKKAKAWRERHRELSCEYSRRSRAKNPERARLTALRWRNNKRSTYYISQIRRRAAISNQEFDLTKQWFDERFSLGSALSGIPFRTTQSGYSPYTASVDRIDNDRGYTMDNCRLILRAENMFKATMNDEEMFSIARAMLRQKDAL